MTTIENETTFLRVSPYRSEDKILGIQVASWNGLPGISVEKTVEFLQSNGFKDATADEIGSYWKRYISSPGLSVAHPPPHPQNDTGRPNYRMP